MIIRKTPEHLENYVKVGTDATIILHMNGFQPKYIDSEYVYYLKTDELINFINKGGLECLK